MNNATLVWSARPGKDFRFPLLRTGEPSPITKLFTSITREKCNNSKRVTFKNNKYCYEPSDEYKNYVIRFRGIKKQCMFAIIISLTLSAVIAIGWASGIHKTNNQNTEDEW